MTKVSKKRKPQKGAFASIFKKANQRAMCNESPGRKKALATAKVATKTGNMNRRSHGHRKRTPGSLYGSFSVLHSMESWQ